MQTEIPIREDTTLTSVRRRSQAYLGYLFWALLVLCYLWASNTVASLIEHWVAMLHEVRRAAGLAAPATGPDYWILGGIAVLALFVLGALAWAYAAYRAAWNRRLRIIWSTPPDSGHVRMRRLRGRADSGELQQRSAYLQALASSSEWSVTALGKCDDPRQSYKMAASAMLRSIEADIAQRAVTAGLVVGLNRNPLIDSLSIAAAAFELQLHVLTRLGKRPSRRAWIELLKRTSGSLFLNTYVSRDDALYLNLAIRKAALGLEMASDSVEEAAGALADVDWDEVLGHVSVPGLKEIASFATMSMSVGAFGLR